MQINSSDSLGIATGRTDLLVVGAGPTGLTLATECLRRGLSVRIIDKAAHASPHAKAVVLWPRAMEAFGRLGIAAEIANRAVPITAANYFTRDRRIARINFGKVADSRYGMPLSLPQNETENILRSACNAAGGHIEYGYELQSLTQLPDGVSLIAGSRRFSADWLVGCDGAHSTTRELAAISFSGATYPQTYALVDGEWDTPLKRSESYYFMHPTGVLVVVGLPDGLTRVFTSLPDGQLGDPVAQVQQLARQRCPYPLVLRSSMGSGVFTVHRRLADTFRRGRVLLAGDAAHVHSPAGGQGLNTGIQDAHELGWRLAGVVRGHRSADDLTEWATERRQVAAGVIRDTDRQTRLWQLAGWRAHARDAMLAAGEHTGMLDRLLPRRLSQLDLRHPGGFGRLGLLREGCRVPDLPAGDGSRIHELLVEQELLLAVVTGPAETAMPGWLAEELDRLGDLAPRLRVLDDRAARQLRASRPGLALIRPDGVVAIAGQFTDPRLAARLRLRLPLLRSTAHSATTPARSH
jgi:2-polyprenyl-6-methoxyphenol hydroxylase-like FAD-dependent oxidoreductase